MTLKKLPPAIFYHQNLNEFMKKIDCLAVFRRGNLIIKYILIMKLTVFLIFLTSFHCIAINSSSQKRINLDLRNKSIITVIKAIELDYEYRFFYTDSVAMNKQKVDLYAKDASIDYVMQQLLHTTQFSYKKINDGFFVIIGKNIFADLPIRGSVTDNLGNPIAGASVIEKATTNGTITSENGSFLLNVKDDNAVLVISRVVYQNIEVAIKENTNPSIVLTSIDQKMEEVVVVGYGSQRKVDLTGAVSSVSVNDMTKRQVAQTSLALQGLIPGVSVTQRSGQPGADGGTISIRGKTTLGNNNALILVDGIEMGINNIDANMIESISVLKDAASAAIYGSRAANGVILITTKRAKVDKFSVSYDGYVGKQSPIDLPHMVNAIDHMRMTNQAYTNLGKSPLYSEAYISEYIKNMGTDPDKYPDTDWIGQTLTNNGLIQNHYVTLSGGSKRVRTIANIGYLDQNGIIENSNFKRYTVRLNNDLEISTKLRAQIDAHLAMTKRLAPSRGDAFHWMGRIPANQAGRLSTGQWGEGWNGDNPIAFTNDGGLQKVDNPSATLNFKLIYKPTDWLTLNGSYSPNYYETHYNSFAKVVQTYKYDGSPYYRAPQKSSLVDQTDRYMRNLLTATATFEKTFKEHGVKLLVGYQQEDLKNTGLQGYRENFPFPDYPILGAGGEDNQKANGWASDWALQSYFGRLNYDFLDKYLFEANIRYDGSSRFAKGHKWGVFPSFSAGWRISEESFWNSLKDVISDLKIRGSWGQLGNQNIGNNYPFSSDLNLGLKYVFNKQVSSGAGITNMANPSITWETTTVTNIGMDLTFWRKINVTADYYKKLTDDILLPLNIPLIIGMGAPQQNAGKVENRGWDLGIIYNDNIKKFNYRVAFNLSDVRNKIIDIKGINETGLTVNREGQEMYSLFGLEAIGYIQPEDYDASGKYLFATQYGAFGPGDIKYKDQNGDGVINSSDRVIIGTTIPRYTFGFSFFGEYKNIDLNILLQGIGKANGYLYGQGIQTFVEGGTVQEQHKNNWTPENRNAKFPRLAFNETNNMQNSSFWMKNAAYMRLKNIQVGYTLPNSLLSRNAVNQLRLYVSADNLFTLDRFWDGFDVEAPVGNGGFYPQLKTISMGVNVKF